MPISYKVIDDGHGIIAHAEGTVSAKEFIDYEVAHATDNRIRTPVSELLIIENKALSLITNGDMERILELRLEIEQKPTPHRLGIVIPDSDPHAWNLARFYEGMVELHSPESVIVFGDEVIARTWLGLGDGS